LGVVFPKDLKVRKHCEEDRPLQQTK